MSSMWTDDDVDALYRVGVADIARPLTAPPYSGRGTDATRRSPWRTAMAGVVMASAAAGVLVFTILAHRNTPPSPATVSAARAVADRYDRSAATFDSTAACRDLSDALRGRLVARVKASAAFKGTSTCEKSWQVTFSFGLMAAPYNPTALRGFTVSGEHAHGTFETPSGNMPLGLTLLDGSWKITEAPYIGDESGHLWTPAPLSNTAERAMAPITQALVAVHASLDCDNGDSGYGMDNREPWYDAYYSVDPTSNLADTVKAAAAAQGYQLVPDTETIGYLKQPRLASGYETYNPHSTYLVGSHDGRKLQVEITRDGEVPMLCSGPAYGKMTAPKPGKAMLSVKLMLPAVR